MLKVGTDIGNDNSAGLRYVGDVSCPEYSGETWEYWSEWRDEWVEDWSTEATCSGPNPTEGPVRWKINRKVILQLVPITKFVTIYN